MPLITSTTAKLALRVDSSTEDDLFTIWIAAAERQAANFLNRNIYADQATLDAAIAAAPAALTAATAAYDAAILAAEALDDEVERGAAIKYAEEAYANAQTDSDRTQRGMVVNDEIKVALILMVSNLYEHRGSDANEMPRAARVHLNPHRVDMGI